MSLSQPINPPTINPGTAKPASSGLLFGSLVARTQVNQLHGLAPNNVIGAGIPKQVSSVQVSMGNAQAGATSTVTVLFRRDSSDTAFSGVNIWVKGYQGNNQLVQVASGADSPATFVLNNTGETVSFTVQAFGNGGNAPLSQAPTNSGVLPLGSGGGFGTGTKNYYNINNPPPSATTLSVAGNCFFGPGVINLSPFLSAGVIQLASANASNGIVTANQVTVYMFSLPVGFTIQRITTRNAENVFGQTATFGIYSLSGSLIIDGGKFATQHGSGPITNTLVAPVVLPAGVYYHAQSASSLATNFHFPGLIFPIGGVDDDMFGMWVLNATRCAQAANPCVSGKLPATLGALTPFVPSNANGDGICCPLYEL